VPSVNRQPSTVNRQPSTANRQPSTVNRQPPTVNRQPSTVNRQPSTKNYSELKMKQYVQYGCGHSAPVEWINFDISPTLRIQKTPVLGTLLKGKLNTTFAPHVKFGDIVRGLPVEDESCDGVYCSHILDNLSFEDLPRALKNSYKILKKGGVFRCVLPDLEFEARTYIRNLDNGVEDASIKFLTDTQLGFFRRPRGLKDSMVALFANRRHLWMWDPKSMEPELKKAGFTEIRRAEFHDCADEMFRLVENDEGRWINAMGFECKK
jgi:SAM-dependent methyltransferase